MRNDKLLESKYNVTFDEMLGFSDEEFHNWCVGLRETVVDLWDNHDLPPVVGYTDQDIAKQFRELTPYPIHDEFPRKNPETGREDIIRNTSNLGNAVNNFFPAMMKTPIGYKGDGTGRSIYDFFAKPELCESFETYARRHFKRDSFYHYSNPVKAFDFRFRDIPMVDYGFAWICRFYENIGFYESRENDFWLCPIQGKEYNGYDEKLKGQQYLQVNRVEIEQLWEKFPDLKADKRSSNVDWERSELYTIRVYLKGQKIFPAGFKAFKISFSQYAVNFPPLTARYLIEKYTKHIKKGKDEKVYVYDSSAGWGGRLLGAMAVRDDIALHYIGTDPNTDNTNRYLRVYDTYIKSVRRGGIFGVPHNTIDMYTLGSEVIHENEKFQNYRGKIDFSFTSPPYFEKEQYSQEATQSFKKFPQYDLWKNGFLRPTIKTISEWLAHDRFCCWNIADVQFGKSVYLLEQDSIDAFKEYGMEYVETLKMALAPMPGGNRTKEDGTGTARNTVKVKGILVKYEPIYVFYKP